MIQFQWRDNIISVSMNTYQRLRELSESFKIKKKSDGTSSTVIVNGNDLQTFDFEFPVIGDARAAYELWRSQLGQYGPLLIQEALFGPDNVMLHGVTLDTDSISNDGRILKGTIRLHFEEHQGQGKQFKSNAAPYVSPLERTSHQEAESAVADLVLSVIYNGVDITDAVDINSCIHDMYACSRSDTLDIIFNDTNKVWDDWGSNKEEIIEVSYGLAKTGKMFINSIKPENGYMTLKASSIPATSKKENNKSWENVYTLQLAKEIADRHGLDFESYGVDDYMYSYVRQENQPDFEFLQKRCDLESLAFVVYDKKLILYSEKYLENQDAAEDVELGPDADYDFSDNELNGYGKITIKNGDLVGSYTASNGISRTLEKVVSTYMSSQSEADRFAKGILRQYNKNLASGYWRDTLRRELSAGSVLNLKTSGAKSWNGKVLVSHIRQDYTNSKSKIFFRKTEVD